MGVTHPPMTGSFSRIGESMITVISGCLPNSKGAAWMKALQTRTVHSVLALFALLAFLPPTGAAQQLSTARLDVDWGETQRHRRLSWSSLDEDQQAVVRNSSIPVLLPGELVGSEGRLHITAGTDWYAASFKGDEHAVLVNGTTTVVLLDGRRPELPTLEDRRPPGAGDPAAAGDWRGPLAPSRGEGIIEVDFEAFGAAYNLSVECFWPEDSRCAGDSYVLGLTDSLAFAAPSRD